MTIKISTATVFHGGRRRWLSLAAACRADAKQTIKQQGDSRMVDGKYLREVTRLADMARAEFDKTPAPAPAAPEQRALAACRELVAATAEVKRLSCLIGESLNACPMMNDPIEYGPKGPITHLSRAYASEEVEYDRGYGDGGCDYRKEWLDECDKREILAECPHCLAAHNAIQERKVARKRLGAARRAVTMIGRTS